MGKVVNRLQADAFKLYYELGSNRSYRLVAEKIGVNPQTVANWSKMFGWRRKVEDMEAKDLTGDKSYSIAELQEQAYVALLNCTIQAILGGHILITNTNDVQKVLELGSIFNANTEGSSESSSNGVIQFPEEYKKWLNKKLDKVEGKK